MKSEKLKILYVAYPLLPVSEASAGGAEQMLGVLEREMHLRGHATAIAACEASRAAGEVFATGESLCESDEFEEREAEHTARIIDFIRTQRHLGNGFDLIHDKSGLFFRHASVLSLPVLATLHLPRHFYRPEMFENCPGDLSFNCVSRAQARTFADLPELIGVVENGIEVSRFPFSPRKRDYLLWMGRICEEKGTHIAIDVAERLGLPLIIVGQVYPFSYHQQYFQREVATRLERASVKVQFVQRPSFTEKVNLLQNARALLIPALVDETSSLVAMEAMACGTPIVAFRRGALPEVVADRETGLIVERTEEMTEAVKHVHDIDPYKCRARVERFYNSLRMASDYEDLYRRVLGTSGPRREVKLAQS